MPRRDPHVKEVRSIPAGAKVAAIGACFRRVDVVREETAPRVTKTQPNEPAAGEEFIEIHSYPPPVEITTEQPSTDGSPDNESSVPLRQRNSLPPGPIERFRYRSR